MKTSLTIGIFLATSVIAFAYTPTEISSESEKANDFFARKQSSQGKRMDRDTEQLNP